MQAAKFQFRRILEIHMFDWNYSLQRAQATITRNCSTSQEIFDSPRFFVLH